MATDADDMGTNNLPSPGFNPDSTCTGNSLSKHARDH